MTNTTTSENSSRPIKIRPKIQVTRHEIQSGIARIHLQLYTVFCFKGPRAFVSGLSEISSSSSIRLLPPIPSESAMFFSRSKVVPRVCISDVSSSGRSSRRSSGLNRNTRAGFISSSSTVDSIHSCI